jgi:hypothetical protein
LLVLAMLDKETLPMRIIGAARLSTTMTGVCLQEFRRANRRAPSRRG